MCHGMTAHPYTTEVIELEKTKYGACFKDGTYRCAVYSEDCVSGEVWLNPIELEELDKEACTCNMVRTGHCIGISPQCVVSEESCDSPSQFRNALSTMNDGIDCFLCDDNVYDNLMTSDGDDKKTSDVDDKKTSDDDDKTTSDDDDKKTSDDDTHSSLANDFVSETTYFAVLGLMIASVSLSGILSIVIVHKGLCRSGKGQQQLTGAEVKAVKQVSDGSVV